VPEVSTIHLIDPSRLVIDVLKKKLVDSYITVPDKIVIENKRGQEIKLDKKKNIIFIAGMGGKEITDILTCLNDQFTGEDRIVISPHKNILELRDYLHTSDLALSEEKLIKEDGQFYQVMCLVKSSSLPRVSLYGDNIWKGEVGSQYRLHILKTFSSHQDNQSKALVRYLESLSY
jgi:tRNA A22 N-methylase